MSTLQSEPLRLDVALVERGLVRSRTKAGRLISSGEVSVNGEVVTKPSRVVHDGDSVTLHRVDGDVGRGAHKLRAALDTWDIPVSGATCVDIGASTGGFTQVLLEHGAAHVVALDVGHDQLDESLRNDPRVSNLEGVHAATLSRQWWGSHDLQGNVSVVVVDVSFISLNKLIPALEDTFGVHTHFVMLIKPQFEVGRGGVDRGVVKDAHKREQSVREVMNTLVESGISPRALIASPIAGEHGNVEYLVYASATPSVHPAEWDGEIPSVNQPKEPA
mgnify:FL=1